jgi:hypothetical protein
MKIRLFLILLLLLSACSFQNQTDVFGVSLPSLNYNIKEEAVFGGVSGDIINYNQEIISQEGNKTLAKISVGQEFYKDINGNFTRTDFNLEDMGAYWRMQKASYKIYIAKQFNTAQLIRFDNKYEGANHTIYYEPKSLIWVNAIDFSDMQVFRNQQMATGTLDNIHRKITYKNAFGDGIDFEVSLLRSGFKKEIIINKKSNLELPPTANHKLAAIFKYRGDNLIVKNTTNTEWNNDAYFEAEDGFTLNEGNGRHSLIIPAYISDSSAINNQQLIKVFWKKYNGVLYQAKILPKVFLNNAVYPVRADTLTQYNPSAGDGWLDTYGCANNWVTCRTKTTSDRSFATNGDQGIRAYSSCYTQDSNYNLGAGFLPINTSGITNGYTISSSSVYLYVANNPVSDVVDNSYDDLGWYQSDQPSTSTLTTADWNNRGAGTTTIASDTWDADNVTAGKYYVWKLNATGLTYVKTGNQASSCGSGYGYTCLVLRWGWDALNQPPSSCGASGKNNEFYAEASENSDANQDPYMIVEYTAPAAAAPLDGFKSSLIEF